MKLINVAHIEIPEISDLPGPETEYLRVARLSLIDELEKSAIDKVRHKHENEEHRSKHPHGAWHKHRRDHGHGHNIFEKPEHGHKHGHKHGPKHRHPHGPPDCTQQGPPHGPPHGPRHGPRHGPPHGPPHKPPHGSPHGPPHGHGKGPQEGPPPYTKDPNAPEDKGYFVLAVIGLFGLVHILPFIFFFTANEYWMYKFRNTTFESTDANDRTFLQTNFASLNKLTITAPGVICNFIAALGGHKIKAQTRVFSVLFIHSSILIVNAVFASIDTDDWQTLFFGLVMLLQLMMSCAMSLGGSGSMGLISKLPPRYMKAQLMGEGGAGVFSAILRLLSIFCTPSTVGAALMYFITGSGLMIITSIAFYFATQTEFFKYYTQSSKEEQKQKVRNIGDFRATLKLLWPFIILSLVTMLVPVQSITNLVVSEFYGTDSIWGNKYFVTVCTYLIPAITGLLGRGIFNYIDFDFPIPLLFVAVISREVIFGALTFLSNAKPRHHLPVLLTHDWQYALMMAGGSLTQGFMMNLTMMKLLRIGPKDRIELSMMVNMFFMSFFMAATSPLGVVATIAAEPQEINPATPISPDSS